MTDVSKNTLAILMIITIMISFIGLWAAFASISQFNKAPTETKDGTISSARVAVTVTGPSPPPEPDFATGKVYVTVVAK